MDQISSSILGPVCRRVSAAALEEYALVRGVKEEIEKLTFSVLLIQRVLRDAERKQEGDDAVSVWLQSLKQILFDAEDVLDEVAADEEALRRADAGGTRRWPITISMIAEVCNTICSLLSGGILHSREIAHKIQDIRKRLDFISGEKDELGLVMLRGGISSSYEVRTNRQLETSFPLDNIIARDDEKEEMERLLLLEYAEGSDNNNLHVIVVDGMGGMGKTTLARNAYNNPVVGQHFEPKMWVCVSNDFDVERITKKIMDVVCTPDELKAFSKISNWDMAQKRLQDKLERKRFLLVLDDVWEKNSSKWESLCIPFMCGGKGSKIVVTTRSQEVANIVKGTRISLRGLCNEDLWPIFERYAFENYDPKTCRQLADVGREIVENLKGLPLAAKTIGRLLNRKLDLEHWRSVLEAKTWRLSQPGEDNILDVLKLSYDYLPGHLKQCFAYCSIFPEDYRFDKEELVQLWMAQQFIEHPGGDECFDGLVHASLLEPYMDEGEYVMHDLIQNLTEKISKGDCFRLEGSGRNFEGNSKTVRHVSIDTESFDPTKFNELCKFENTRTLLFLRRLDSQLDRQYLDDLFTKLQRLRVLGLSGCKIKELPTSIGTLKHLRYLDLSENYGITKLPGSLCKLLNLQIKELPASIGTLRHLQFLDLSSTPIKKLPESLCELLNLQVLKLQIAKIEELPTSIGSLRHLRLLDLSWTSISKLPESLCELLDLQVLDLRGCGDLAALPGNMSALINLRHLYADDDDRLLVSSIRGLGKLTALQELDFDCRGQKMMGEVLANMDMLRKLQISSLEEVESKEEVSESRLDMKEDLEELTLAWGNTLRRVINNPGLEEEVIQSLMKSASNSTCRRLTIQGYGGIRSPGWMDDLSWLSSSSSLERVELHYCTNWEVLPPLGQLPRLRFLTISRMDSVRRVGPRFMGYCRGYAEDGGGVLVGVPGGGGGGGFPLLEELEFNDMREWEEWEAPPQQQCRRRQYDDDDDDDDGIINDHDDGAEEEDDRLRRQKQPPQQQQQQQQPHPPHPQRRQEFLPRLRRLVIVDCPKLRQLPPLPPTLTELEIRRVGLTHLPRWWGLQPSSSTLISSPSSSPALSSLRIEECPNLTSLPDGLLPRLGSLKISRSSVRQMKAWLLQCPPSSLQELTIRDCPQLTSFGGTDDEDDDDDGGDDDVDGGSGGSASLSSFGGTDDEDDDDDDDDGGDDDVDGGSGGSASLLETALLERLAPALRRLVFRYCKNLRSLPPNLRCLSSLESLKMGYCPEIRSLPAGGLPESLRSLTIYGCPALKERCKRGEGADWHLISHIDRLDIG